MLTPGAETRAVPRKRPSVAQCRRQVSRGLTFPRHGAPVCVRPFPLTSQVDSNIRVPQGRHLGDGPPPSP